MIKVKQMKRNNTNKDKDESDDSQASRTFERKLSCLDKNRCAKNFDFDSKFLCGFSSGQKQSIPMTKRPLAETLQKEKRSSNQDYQTDH